MSDSSKIEKLIQDLKDRWRRKEEDVVLKKMRRERAAKELGETGDPRAVEPLINTLKDWDDDSSLRREAAVALGKIGDKRAVESLVEVMKEDEVLVSAEAARALGNIGGARAVEALAKTLREDSRIYEPSEYLQLYQETVSMAREAARALGNMGDARAVEALIEALNSFSPSSPYSLFVPGYAMEALGEIGDARAVEPLISKLGEGGDIAVTALVRIGDAAVEPLIKALKEEDGSARMFAVEALGKIGDARAVRPLIETLKDEAESVQEAAVMALSKIGGEEAKKGLKTFPTAKMVLPLLEKNRDVEGLIKVLKEDTFSSVRDRAAWVLGKIGDARAVQPLLQALKDEASAVRYSAAWALGEIGDIRAVEPLNRALKEGYVERTSAEIALQKIRSKKRKLR